MVRTECDDKRGGIMMGAGGDKHKTCDPKYYGSGVKNCGNSIRGLEELLKKMEEKTDED